MLQLIECPRTSDELELLIRALKDTRFDKSPEQIAKELQEVEGGLRASGHPEISIQRYMRILENRQEDDEARVYMQRWGRNRSEAIRSYTSHFKRPCNWCVDLYTDILAVYAIDEAKSSGIVLDDPANLQRLISEAHDYYLGNPALNHGNEIRLDDFLTHPN